MRAGTGDDLLRKAVATAAAFAFIETLSSFLTGFLPLGDVIPVFSIPLVLLGVVAVALTKVLGRWLIPRADALLLLLPVFIFGMRGGLVDPRSGGVFWPHLVRFGLTAMMSGAILLLALLRGPAPLTLPGFIGLTIVIQLAAAIGYGLRSDQYAAFTTKAILECAVLATGAGACACFVAKTRSRSLLAPAGVLALSAISIAIATA